MRILIIIQEHTFGRKKSSRKDHRRSSLVKLAPVDKNTRTRGRIFETMVEKEAMNPQESSIL